MIDNGVSKRDQLEALTNLGIQVVPVWWVDGEGKCACGTNCGPRNKGKHPLPGIGWPDRATSDLRKIDNWLASYPDANWGVLTGVRSNVFVVDVDAKSGGHESLAKLVAEHGALPPTLEAKTGGGGRHLYFMMPKGTTIQTRIGLVDGVDIKGEGNSQVVAPPSVHLSGGAYEWVVTPGNGTRPAEAPQWLVDLVLKGQKKATMAHVGLDGTAKLGTRDDEIFHNALQLLKSGMAPELVVNSVWAWAEAGGVEQTPQDPIDRGYVEGKVEAARSFLDRSDGDPDEPMLNDEGNARLLVPEVKGKLLHTTGVEWLQWTGTHWATDPDVKQKAVTDYIAKLLEELLRAQLTTVPRDKLGTFTRWLQVCLNEAKLATAMAALARQVDIRVTADQLDTDPFALNFANGTLDLRTGELKPHSSGDYITKLLPFDYDPKAKCPTWDATLDFAFGDNTEARAYFLEALGYSLTGDQSRQEMYIPWGEDGNNGKSTLLNAVLRIMRGYAGVLDAGAVEADRYGSTVMSQLAQLRGARFALVAETKEGMVLNEGLIKLATGGERLTVRDLYKSTFDYLPQFKIWIMTNDKPVVRSGGEPTWRRIKLIPFELVIPVGKRDDRSVVDAALDREAPGIVAQLVKAYVEFRRARVNRTWKEPKYITDATKGYRDENDTITIFLGEEYEEAKQPAEVLVRDMYTVFLTWCKNQGIRYPMSSVSFLRRLRKVKKDAVSNTRKGNSFVVYGLKRREFTFGPNDTN